MRLRRTLRSDILSKKRSKKNVITELRLSSINLLKAHLWQIVHFPMSEKGCWLPLIIAGWHEVAARITALYSSQMTLEPSTWFAHRNLPDKSFLNDWCLSALVGIYLIDCHRYGSNNSKNFLINIIIISVPSLWILSSENVLHLPSSVPYNTKQKRIHIFALYIPYQLNEITKESLFDFLFDCTCLTTQFLWNKIKGNQQGTKDSEYYSKRYYSFLLLFQRLILCVIISENNKWIQRTCCMLQVQNLCEEGPVELLKNKGTGSLSKTY